MAANKIQFYNNLFFLNQKVVREQDQPVVRQLRPTLKTDLTQLSKTDRPQTERTDHPRTDRDFSDQLKHFTRPSDARTEKKTKLRQKDRRPSCSTTESNLHEGRRERTRVLHPSLPEIPANSIRSIVA